LLSASVTPRLDVIEQESHREVAMTSGRNSLAGLLLGLLAGSSWSASTVVAAAAGNATLRGVVTDGGAGPSEAPS
jgi:hypothetical protein